MKKLSKKNKIGKYQTAWAPLGLNVGPVSLSTGVSLPEVVGGTSILPVATAASFPIGEIMNYKLHQNGGGVTTSPYSTTSVYTPELSDATYVTTPRGVSTGDYIYEVNPLGWVGEQIGKGVKALTEGYNKTRSQEQQTTELKGGGDEKPQDQPEPKPKEPKPEPKPDPKRSRKIAKVLGLWHLGAAGLGGAYETIKSRKFWKGVGNGLEYGTPLGWGYLLYNWLTDEDDDKKEEKETNPKKVRTLEEDYDPTQK